jgi:hypothetical protein
VQDDGVSFMWMGEMGEEEELVWDVLWFWSMTSKQNLKEKY